MAIFIPRTFPEIFGNMVDNILAVTPLTDVNFGSVWTSLLEAAAQEDDEQYFQMLDIIRNFSLDTTTGDDLDNRAFEFGLERLGAAEASSIVTLGDTAITKVSTGVYSGQPGAAAGTSAVNGDNAIDFPTPAGSIIVGRGTPNAETIAYTSITVNPNYVTFNLSASLAFDHGTDETIVLSQGGNRLISSGTVVFVPASDISAQIDFSTTAAATILDGEEDVENVPVVAGDPGSASNVPIGAITTFDSAPFSTATVRNPRRVTNGRDEESDQELRDRIKDTIQSLSLGTARSVTSGVIGVISESENKRVVSASIIEPTTPAGVVKLFIDDGTGFVPSFTNVGFETVVASATGGEKFLKTANVPLVKAFVETQSTEPFTLSGTETLFVDVGGVVETITFASTDFDIPGSATAQEVLEVINTNAANYEARISSGGDQVRIFSRGDSLEEITVTGGTANTALAFPTDTKFTAKLYRKRGDVIQLLTKDGRTASIESGNPVAYDYTTDTSLVVVVDGKEAQNLYILASDFALPATVTASEICDVLDAQLSGADCAPSSNDTKITLASNVERSVGSKVRVVELFSQVWNEEAAVLTDRTTEVQTDSTNVTIFGADLDFLYLGHADVKFNNVSVILNTLASADVGLVFEYWDGSTWSALGARDGTDGFQQDGDIRFSRPQDWTQVAVNGSALQYWIRLQRNQAVVATPPIESRIKVCGGNEELGFSEVEEAGADKDYTLNRFIGQIELEQPLQALDVVTLGATETRARIVTAAAENYGLAGGELFEIVVDGTLQSYTFLAGDFFTPGAALSSEVVIAINREIAGVTASTNLSGANVIIETNTLNSGSLQVNATAANTILQFPTTLVLGFIPHIPATESVAETFVFLEDDSVVMVIDGNAANSFTVPCFSEGTLTGATSPSDFDDTALTAIFPTDGELVGYDYINTTSRTAVIQDLTYLTTEADPVTIEYTTGAAAGAEVVGVIGNAITIQIDTGVSTATQVETAFNASGPATALASVSISGAGATPQTAPVAPTTLVPERDSILTYTAATGKITLTTGFSFTPSISDSYQIFPVTAQQVVDLWNNIAITLLTTEAAIKTSSSGTKVQVESLDIGEAASVQVSGSSGNAVLLFSLVAELGVDGYRYFTGLAQLAQKTIDGDPLDEENFPGIRAAGVQIEVADPVTKPIEIEISITPESGVTLSSLTNNVKSAVSAYVNGLFVGDDVIVSEITCVVKDVSGVFDAQVVTPTSNIAIADGELARVNEESIVVG